MNLSETAFVHHLEGNEAFSLRWFTPLVEVDLCGHATLATAHVLWEEGWLSRTKPAWFETRSGRLSAHLEHDWIALDFPSEPIQGLITSAQELESIVAALESPVVAAGRNRFDLLVELADEETVRKLRPDFRRVAAFPVRGVIATSRSSDTKFDFVSRFFAPAVGIDEDPVCGSAHCCLAPYWAAKLGKSELIGHQISARGGVVKVRDRGSRVALIGQAVTVLRGEIVA